MLVATLKGLTLSFPIYVGLQRMLMDEHEMLGVSDSDSSDDDALELA